MKSQHQFATIFYKLKYFDNLKRYFLTSDNSGSAFIYLIVMAIIIFSVLIVGGRFNIGGKESTFRTLTPTPEIQPTSPPEGSQPDPTTAPLEWSITYKFLRCEGNLIVGNFVAVGDAPGYIKTEIKNPDGSYDFSYNGEFLGGTKEFGSPIHPESRARTSPWRAQLYSGGQLDGIMWSDGELKTTLDGVAFTQCS